MTLPWTLFVFVNAFLLDAYAFDALPRWGQAVVAVNDALYVYGGKTDQFNTFGYYTAPNTNDILYLSLSSPFSAQAPPWTVVSGLSNSSTAQGPDIAWHTASAFTSSSILMFGGSPDANSNIVLVGAADSASTLDVWNRLSPAWTIQPTAWANQPTRRMRHSTATIPSGLIFIFGGERADGSGIAYSDHYVFNGTIPSFTLLPTSGGPSDLVGHASIPLPDGRILVFGGYSPSASILILFSTIYVLNTTTTPYTWSLLQVSSGALPSPRRAFAAVLIAPNKILIHGGTDAQLQSAMDDGWILDMSQPIAVWVRVDALTAVGARKDHFAVLSCNQVVFGFGYSETAPVPDSIQIYDPQASTIAPSFTPITPTATPMPTLPIVTKDPAHPTGSGTGTGGTTPIVTGNPNPNSPGADNKGSRTAVIAVSATIGALALVLVVVGGAWYRRNKQKKWERRRFWVIDGDDAGPVDDDDSQLHRDIPLAGHGQHETSEARNRPLRQTLLTSIGFGSLLGGSAAKPRDADEARERRNMLDDEDGADFGTWYNSRRREGTGGSSWSLMSIIGRRIREPSSGHGTGTSTPWREKADPLSGSLEDEEAGFIGGSNPVRPTGRRELSHVSARSGLSYTDPFTDPLLEDPREPSSTAYDDGLVPVRLIPPPSSLPNIRTSLPLDFERHALSPLSERTSSSTLRLQDSSLSTLAGPSNENVITPFAYTSSNTLQGEPPRSPTLLSGLLPATDGSLKRNGSWWSRLARRASESSRATSQYRDIRDPNPPPRLEVIDEKITPEKEMSEPSKRLSTGSAVRRSLTTNDLTHPYVYKHGKSMSSVRTADSDAIEKMAGTMEVVQRMHSDGGEKSSVYSLRAGDPSTDEGPPTLAETTVMSPIEMTDDLYEYHRAFGGDGEGGVGSGLTAVAVRAPVPRLAPVRGSGDLLSTSSTPSVSSSKSTSPVPVLRPTSGGSSSGDGGLRSAPLLVSALSGGLAPRAQGRAARRVTMTEGGPRPPRNTEERAGGRVTVDYGLVPRRSLFIANPDRKLSGSEE